MSLITYESELELKLKELNGKIIFYNKLYSKMPLNIMRNIVLKKMIQTRTQRDYYFTELRNLIKRKYPEKLIGGNYGQ